jgi:hypothetical protein
VQDITTSLAVGFVAGFIIGFMARALPSWIASDGAGQNHVVAEPDSISDEGFKPKGSNRSRLSIIKTKVAGVSFDNDDGTSRQSIILKYATDGRELVLVPDPNNEYDPDAVGVFLESPRKQLGYLNRVRAQEFMEYKGRYVIARITQVTGHDKSTLGVNIEIVYRR